MTSIHLCLGCAESINYHLLTFGFASMFSLGHCSDIWHSQKFKRPLPLFTTAKLCNHLKCPSSRDCIRKMEDICTVGFYLAIKKKLNYVIWAKMARNIPHGVKQTQSNLLWVFSPLWNQDSSIKLENRRWTTWKTRSQSKREED